MSYHHRDADEVECFVREFQRGFASIATVGVTDGDLAGVGTDLGALRSAISTRYLRDADATVVLIGQSTWARRFVDWEIAATLADGVAPRRGLVGITLPSVTDGAARLPERLAVNLPDNGTPGYAVISDYPADAAQLNRIIGDSLRRSEAQTPSHRSFGPLMRRDHIDDHHVEDSNAEARR